MKKLLLLVAFAASGLLAAGAPYRITGQGWAEAGGIAHATDTFEVNLNGNTLQSAGAQFTAYADIGDNWEGAFGFGGYQVHQMQGNDYSAKYLKFSFRNFITEARMTWFRGDREAPRFSLTFGNFDYDYNPDVKNLGLYLLRGAVYPGILVSGFMDPAVDPTKSDALGLKIHHAAGPFSQDLLFLNERQFPPDNDWSLAYVAKLRPAAGLEIGAGVNFYRVLPANSELTTPDVAAYYKADSSATARGADPYAHLFTEGVIDSLRDAQGKARFDSTGRALLHYVPTVEYTHQGVKVMGMFAFDPKKSFGMSGRFGAEDLKLYGEAALIGWKNYGSIYSDPLQRIPVMLGFNVPTCGLLDVLSVEVEWYGALYRNDVTKLTDDNKAPLPSPLPLSYDAYAPFADLDAQGRYHPGDSSTVQIRGTDYDIENMTSDDWKWSIFLRKTVRDHIRFTAQMANDHFRPEPVAGGCCNAPVGGTAEAFTTLDDWYFMFRMGYFF